MTTLRCQVTFPRDNAFSEDNVVNTFHFHPLNGSNTLAARDQIASKLNTFYQAVDQLMSESLTGAYTLKIYDLSDPEPRVPSGTYTGSITPAVGASLPNEIALCMSFRGDTASGQNAARRRGRIYLGPFPVSTQEVIAGDTRPNLGLRNTIAAAAQALRTPIVGDLAAWSVFSPTTAGPQPWTDAEVDAATFPVVSGWVDNAWDVVRSRGTAATARSTF